MNFFLGNAVLELHTYAFSLSLRYFC